MKYLNLTEGFKPILVAEAAEISFETFKFSGGEPHIKLKTHYDKAQDVTITVRLNSSDDLILLLMATDVIYQSGWANKVHLIIPYLPGARQDRRMVPGEPLSVAIYAEIINSREYDSVTIYDNHSDVGIALLDNVDPHNNHKFIEKVVKDVGSFDDNLLLVSPDAGAHKKIHALGAHLKTNNILKCDKNRDTSTGKLSGFQVYSENLAGFDCLIVDDICDGGGTFIGLADELKKKNAGKLYLAVSHGIFSKGLEELEMWFDCIYTTDSICTLEDVYSPVFLEQGRLKQFKLNELV